MGLSGRKVRCRIVRYGTSGRNGRVRPWRNSQGFRGRSWTCGSGSTRVPAARQGTSSSSIPTVSAVHPGDDAMRTPKPSALDARSSSSAGSTHSAYGSPTASGADCRRTNAPRSSPGRLRRPAEPLRPSQSPASCPHHNRIPPRRSNPVAGTPRGIPARKRDSSEYPSGRLHPRNVTGALHDEGPGPYEDRGLRCVVRRSVDHFDTTASTSRAERIRYSSPAYLTSVPPYLL